MYFIALKMLICDSAKYFGLIITIAMATFLMAQQLSIFAAAMNRTGSQINDVKEADIWVMDPSIEYFEEIKPLRSIDLYRVRGVPGVKWAMPFFKGSVIVHPTGRVMHQAFLYGVDDTSLTGQPKMKLGDWKSLLEPNSIIIDDAGWQLIFENKNYRLGQLINVNDQQKKIVGIADPSAPFFAFPLLYTTYSQAIQTARQGKSSLSFILVKADKGVNTEQLAKSISNQTNLQALTSDQFKWRSIHYVLTNTPIPINFGLTVTLGFLIGIVVVGQTFYLFLIENLPQFGLLKAVGVTNKQILSMIMIQALWIAWIGFGIGIGLCALFSQATAAMFMNLRGVYVPWQVILITGICVLIIILCASFMGIKKLTALDPAIVFRG